MEDTKKLSLEEKLALYKELHPDGNEFPKNKKPWEKPSDMEWLDLKLDEFKKLADKNNLSEKEDNITANKVHKNTDDFEIFTVDQIKCLDEKSFKSIVKKVESGKIKIIN